MCTAIVNDNERNCFLQSIYKTGYAGISQIQTIYHTMPISAHRQQFILGKRGVRDGHRSALFMEATQLKNACARVLQFFISLSKCGYRGSICPEDVLANQIVSATGGLCAPRTFRRALAELCRRGWLVKRNMSTGSKVPTKTGWITLQVNKITIPQCTRLLGVKCLGSKQKNTIQSAHPRGEQLKNHLSCSPCPTQAKTANNAREEIDSPPLKGGESYLHIVNVKEISKAQNNEEMDSQRLSPRHSAAARISAPLKHKIIKTDAQKPQKTKKTNPAPFARKSRSKILRTWQNSRLLFLHDLKTALPNKNVENENFLLRIAKIQTDLCYPPLFPVALDWEKYLISWLELDWHERRKTITRDILPDLSAWCSPWRLPAMSEIEPSAPASVRAEAEIQISQYHRIARIVKSLPDMLIDETTPRWICEKIDECRWQLSELPILLTTGKMELSDIRTGELQLFFELSELLGQN